MEELLQVNIKQVKKVSISKNAPAYLYGSCIEVPFGAGAYTTTKTAFFIYETQFLL